MELNKRFHTWAGKVGIPASVSLHSFHGSHAVNQEAEGVPREDICAEMVWQEATRSYYVDGREVLGLEALLSRLEQNGGRATHG